MIFITENSGSSFRKYHVNFVPRSISFHPKSNQVVLAYDEKDSSKRVCILICLFGFNVAFEVSSPHVQTFCIVKDSYMDAF